MDRLRRNTISPIRFLKQLNLFDTYSTDAKKIRHEILSTRIYLILFPTLLTVLIIYSAQKELYHIVQINNPSLEKYQQLIHAYPDTLMCPCSQLSIPYAAFVTLTPHMHPVCSSDFVSDRWLDYLYYNDASFYIPYDIRSVGNAQFQLLRTLCHSSTQVIDNAFKATFTSAVFVSSRGLLSNSELAHAQMKAFTNDFITSISSEQQRRRTLFSAYSDRNFLISALGTAALAQISDQSKLKMIPTLYVKNLNEEISAHLICRCNETYACAESLVIFDNSIYESNIMVQDDVPQLRQSVLEVVDGFQSGCLPLNSLLTSTLQCYYNQSCLDNVMIYLRTNNSSFRILDRSVSNQSNITTAISALADRLMVEEWSTEMNYSQYFAACRPLSCSYTYTEKFSILYIVTTLIGLLGGLIAILVIVCPQITSVSQLIQKYIIGVDPKKSSEPLVSAQHQSSESDSDQLRIKFRGTFLTLNLFAHRNTEPPEVREQILTTRLYIGCLLVAVLMLVSVTTFESQTKTNIVSIVSMDQFEDLFQSGKNPQSCPCSEITIKRSEFITLQPTFHPICSSEFISKGWTDFFHAGEKDLTGEYLDFGLYGVDIFQTVASFCSLANQTTMDEIAAFLNSDFVTTQVLPRQHFNEQTQSLIRDFQLDLENTFKQLFKLAEETNQGNQLLTTKMSNFYFDGLFNNASHLIGVQMYTGTVSSFMDSSPTCSCILDRCTRQLGVAHRDLLYDSFNVEIDGMYGGCYPLHAIRMSTFECWFRQGCTNIIWNQYVISVIYGIDFDALDSNTLKRFSPNTLVSDILDNLMIDVWTNDTNYEKYYNICRPSTCTYTTYHRFDWLYTITIFTSLIGGLSVSFRIVCPRIIKLYFYFRRKRSVITVTNQTATVRVGRTSRISNQLRHLIFTVNVFDSDSPHEHIQHRERLSTRLYVILLLITAAFLFIYMSFVQNTRTITVNFPASKRIAQLSENYRTTLSCPCTKTSISYATFLSLKVVQHHPICSSSVLSRDYLQTLLTDNLLVVPDSTSSKRQFLAGQLSLLSSYCALANQTVNDSIALFLRQQFINAQVLTADQFDKQIDGTVNRFLLDLSLSLRQSLDYFQSTIHGNAIMSSYLSNWRFVPSSKANASTIRTRPVWYGNCSCASSKQCSVPMMIDNITFEGLSVGCLPSSVLLQSTLECFYDDSCVYKLHNALFDNVNSSTLPRSVDRSSRFPPNTSVGSLFDEFFIEEWFHENDYQSFFETCGVMMCTYTYSRQPDMPYVITTMIGLLGGLNVVFRLICPVLMIGFIYLVNRVQNRYSTPVEIYVRPVPSTMAVSSVGTTNDTAMCEDQPVVIETQSPSSRRHCWKRNCRNRIIVVQFMLLVICVIFIIKTRGHSSIISVPPSRTNTSNTSAISVRDYCPRSAKWRKGGVTVAGFSNGMSSSSLDGLNHPSDLYLDPVGNMYITDSLNNRVLYWAKNAAEGRVVIGTNQSGSENNTLNAPTNIRVFKDRMYVYDTGNNRIQSFQLGVSGVSSFGNTLLQLNSDFMWPNTNVLLPTFAIDSMRNHLYFCDVSNDRLVIFQITENGLQRLNDSELFSTDDFTIYPHSVVIDPSWNYFYVSDINSIFKFQIGSTKGTVIAGGMYSASGGLGNMISETMDIAFDSKGFLYIVDYFNSRVVQLMDEYGNLRTVAGLYFRGTTSFHLSSPTAIQFDQSNNLYVVDSGNNRVQRFDLYNNGC